MIATIKRSITTGATKHKMRQIKTEGENDEHDMSDRCNNPSTTSCNANVRVYDVGAQRCKTGLCDEWEIRHRCCIRCQEFRDFFDINSDTEKNENRYHKE